MGYSQEDSAEDEEKAVADADARIARDKAAPTYRGYYTPEKEAEARAAARAGAHKDHGLYKMPGSADYGGKGGVDLYRNQALSHMGDNDPQQASNESAMAASLKNMTTDRGPQVQEDPRLAGRADATRRNQLDALDLNRQAAMGNAPSEAAYQTQIGMNDVMSNQAGAMGSARGLSAMGGAQGIGAQAAGQSASNLAMSGGMARSKEIGDALGMYGSMAGQVRGQDFNRLGISDQNGLANVRRNDDWKIGNANLLAGQGKLGINQGATDLAWRGEAMKPADKQFQYDQEIAAITAGADADAAGASIASAREDKENTRNIVNGAGTAALTAVGSMAGPAGSAGGAAAGGMLGSATKRYW